MTPGLSALFRRVTAGEGLIPRAIRVSAFTVAGFAGSQALRLAANLLLTRLLDPAAFGLMAIVTVFIAGLSMFSDVGLGPSITRSPRGDDPEFLDTAWTIQAIRGALLWGGCWALAAPAAAFYDARELAVLLPLAGVSVFLSGFYPTRMHTAARHLRLGRVVLLNLASQLVGIVAMTAAALASGSVWALALGAPAAAAAQLVLMSLCLEGRADRFRWERRSVSELVGFGKWIFLSTMLAFVIAQGDKAVLGRYLTLESLGVFNIGFFLASFPMMFSVMLNARVFPPLYREIRDGVTGATALRRRVRQLRAGLTAATLGLLIALAFLGGPLVEFLFDPRYERAGAVVVGLALSQLPLAVGLTYDQAALAGGDSRGFFRLFAARATVQFGAFLLGLELAGLTGAMIGQGCAAVATHALIVGLARRHGSWDPIHDAVALVVAALGGAAAFAFNRDLLAALAGFV